MSICTRARVAINVRTQHTKLLNGPIILRTCRRRRRAPCAVAISAAPPKCQSEFVRVPSRVFDMCVCVRVFVYAHYTYGCV